MTNTLEPGATPEDALDNMSRFMQTQSLRSASCIRETITAFEIVREAVQDTTAYNLLSLIGIHDASEKVRMAAALDQSISLIKEMPTYKENRESSRTRSSDRPFTIEIRNATEALWRSKQLYNLTLFPWVELEKCLVPGTLKSESVRRVIRGMAEKNLKFTEYLTEGSQKHMDLLVISLLRSGISSHVSSTAYLQVGSEIAKEGSSDNSQHTDHVGPTS